MAKRGQSIKKLLALLLLLSPVATFAQGSRFDSNATRSVQGFLAPIPGATITLCTSAGNGTPCSPLVPTIPPTLCTDSTCSVAAANSFLADANGNFGFWALPGTYKYSITAAGVTGQLLTVTLPCVAGISCVATNFSNTFTALQNFNSGLTTTTLAASGQVIGAGYSGPSSTLAPFPNGFTTSALTSADIGGELNFTEVAPFTAAPGIDTFYGDSAAHCTKVAYNNGSFSCLQRFSDTTLTLKKGSGAGNYTTASTSYVVADSTNLCYTVTIPTGWKLSASVSGSLGTLTGAVLANYALTDNAACTAANAGILVEGTETGTAAGVQEPFALNWIITGDGASHNVALQYKTSNGADSATLLNASATQLPTMVFHLMPSN